MQESGSIANFTLQCPKCGLWLNPGVFVCPHDGTRIFAAKEGELFEEKYQLLAKLASGGMGVVFKAKQVGLGRVVAIKMLHMANATETSIRRFQQEAQALAVLDHPHLVRVYELGVTAYGQPYTVMEFIDGKGLDLIIQDKGRLPLNKALDIFQQVCEGLQYVHDCGVLHRDLKPSNIMLIDPDSDRPKVKLVDFGIAKIVDGAAAKVLTQTGEVFGSPLYMSPEQAKGLVADQRSDIYSLGCVMYEVLTGQQVFSAATVVELILKQVGEPAKPMNKVVRGEKFPNAVESMVAKMLEKNPTDRYQSVYELSKELNKVVRQSRDWYQVSVPAVLRRAGLDPIWVVGVALGTLVIGAAAFGAYSLLSTKPPKSQTKINLQDLNALTEALRGGADEGEPESTKGEDPFAAQQRMREYKNEAYRAILSPKKSIDLDEIPLPPGSFAIFKQRKQRYVTEISSSGQSSLTNSDLKYIEDFPLSDLELAKCSITGDATATIAKIDTLEKLSLDYVKLSPANVKELAKLAWLRQFYANKCGLNDECCKEMRGFKRLAVLYADGNSAITAAGLEQLSHMHLRTLSLGNSGIDDSGAASIGRMTDLSWLDLHGCPAGDRTFDALSKLKGMRALNLNRTAVTDEGLARFKPGKLAMLSLIACPKLTEKAVSQFREKYPAVTVEYAPIGKQTFQGIGGRKSSGFETYPDEIK